jgi:hypothetical protein
MTDHAASVKTSGLRSTFRRRGGEITRVEALSDAVFAFAVTLLIVSLEVPKTFHDLLTTMHGFGAFALCFILLINIWYEQYIFFRRYGLEDTWTITLNAALLFVVLFYIYPLKFLFSMLVNIWTGQSLEVHLPGGRVEAVIEGAQLPQLFVIFGAGYVAVFLVFLLLYLHAYKKRRELELTALESFDTKVGLYAAVFHMGVGASSILVALAAGLSHISWAGYIYPLLLGPGLTVYYSYSNVRRRRLEPAAALAGS